MLKLATAAQMREMDRRTIEDYGVPSLVLMENAALRVVDVIGASGSGRCAASALASSAARATTVAMGWRSRGTWRRALARMSRCGWRRTRLR